MRRLFLNLMPRDSPGGRLVRSTQNLDVMMTFRMGWLLLFLCLAQLATAQKYSNEFLNIGVNARARGMGSAQAASVSDVTAGYWNPAGLTQLKAPQVGAMHTEWFAGIGTYDYVGLAIPLADGQRALGVSFIRFGIDDIPNTLSLYESDGTINYDNIVPFSAADYAVILSYAQPVAGDKLTLGGSAKVIRRTIGPFAQSWGFGLDVGAQYKINDHWQLGAIAKDITGTFNAWQFSFTDEEKQVLSITGNDIPINSLEVTNPQLVLAAAYRNRWGDIGALAEVNAILFTDGRRNTVVATDAASLDPLVGLELDYKEFLFLRGGVNNIQQEVDLVGDTYWGVHPNLGLGLRFKNLQLDYAFTNVGESEDNTYSHVISLIVQLNPNLVKR